MDWLRLYSGVLNDPKVQRLPLAIFKGWINLLCLANESDPRGSLPGQEDIAFALRLSDGDATELVSQLKSAGLLDESDGALSPHNWDGRQHASDDVNVRVARFRERKRQVTPGNAEVTPSNATETLPATLHVTPPDPDTDTDTDTEQKQNREEQPQAPPAAAVAAPVVSRTRKKVVQARSPDLQRAVDAWVTDGLGPVSQRAETGLRELVGAHGVELVVEGLKKASDEGISGPVAWLKVVLPSWERSRSSSNGTHRPNTQGSRNGRYAAATTDALTEWARSHGHLQEKPLSP